MLEGAVALIILGFALGLRHGIDWDHIAAITDITSSTVTTEEVGEHIVAIGSGGQAVAGGFVLNTSAHSWHEARQGFALATLYALGHATVVALLGLLAIWLGTILPDWIDPVMEWIVGATLIFLGVWIFYSLWRYGRSFRLQSRWMLIFALVQSAWTATRRRLSKQHIHSDTHTHDIAQYGAKTAFGVGMIHGIGAETGSQALLLASAAGATTQQSGSLMLLAFVVGLVVSNSLIAVFAVFGFVSSRAKRNVYLAIGVLAGIFSLIVGGFFITGRGSALPDLQSVLNALFGSAGS